MARQEDQNNGVQYLVVVLERIRAIRHEHAACTMHELARQLRKQPAIMSRTLHQIRDLGLVTWTPMTGSLRLTARGGVVIAKIRSGKMTELPRKPDPTESPIEADLEVLQGTEGL